MGTCAFPGEQPGVGLSLFTWLSQYSLSHIHTMLQDLPFDVYEEMHIINPLPVSLHIETGCCVDSELCFQDLCWYLAQKTEEPDKKGNIPVSHVRLVYISDDGQADMILNSLCGIVIVISLLPLIEEEGAPVT